MSITQHRDDAVSVEHDNYFELLQQLSEASVNMHFRAFEDIAWDSPEFEIIPDDDRWILTEADEIGAHPWYKSLPRDRQIEIGMYRMAQIAKVGSQFEQLLIAGLMNNLVRADNFNPEFRYAMHEVTEECNHIQMFQESVNRSGIDVSGTSSVFKMLFPLVASAGSWFPEAFFVGILAGEEPIDHLQKSIMRAGGTHPLVDRIMQIHIAEEARHIGFAHQYIEHHWGQMNPAKRALLTLIFPIIMRSLCDVIMVPSKRARADMGIPDEVAKEIWWDSPASEKLLRDLFGDVRMLADGLGIRKGPVRRLWKMLGIDGAPSRFRSEPASAAV